MTWLAITYIPSTSIVRARRATTVRRAMEIVTATINNAFNIHFTNCLQTLELNCIHIRSENAYIYTNINMHTILYTPTYLNTYIHYQQQISTSTPTFCNIAIVERWY